MKMIFMGRKSYGAEMLEWSIAKGIEVVAVCTDPISGDNPVVSMAKKMDIPVITMEDAERLSENDQIDIVVSYLHIRKIRKPLIENPTYGCINFHPAILPDWRGTAGYNIAILNKLPQWGATAHYVDESIDTGAIIRVFRFDFDYRHETALSLERKTQVVLQDLYKSVLSDVLETGRLDSITQDIGSGTYISRDEMNDLKRLDLDNDDIDLKIRAFWFPPYQGAYTEINGKKYTLINQEILDQIAKNHCAINRGGYQTK